MKLGPVLAIALDRKTTRQEEDLKFIFQMADVKFEGLLEPWLGSKAMNNLKLLKCLYYTYFLLGTIGKRKYYMDNFDSGITLLLCWSTKPRYILI